MIKYYFISPAFILFYTAFFISCNQSDEQRNFERDSLRLPESITETGNNGAIINNNSDPDDWRISPFFQGVVSVDPPYPNPLLTNEHLNIEIWVTGVDGVSGLRILVFYNENSLRLIYEDFRSPLPTGFNSILLDAPDIARFNENPAGLYRLIIEDSNSNIITYGDIKIE